MIQAFAALLAAVSVSAATTPLEADFPEGYWDRDVTVYGARSATSYNISVAVEDPAKARVDVTAAFKIPGAKLLNFSDQTLTVYQSGVEMSGMMRMRPAYMLSYQVPDAQSSLVARKISGIGRLISYNMQTPFANPQKKEIDDRIDWIEKELKRSGEALKTMPVSRAMLESKLKRLRASLDAAKAVEGVTSISVQIIREDPEAGQKPAAASTTP